MGTLDIAERAMRSLDIHESELGSGILAAVSGGSDSMALAILLRDWCADRSVPLLAAVCDHGLRRESASEAATVRASLEDLGIEARVLSLRLEPGGSGIQERARHARHSALRSLARRAGLGCVAFGHHAMDQAETVAHRLESGGAGVRSLAGILPARPMEELLYLRPLLSFGKGELRDIVRENSGSWVEDPSNSNAEFTRVRIRSELLRQPARVEELLEMSLQARLALRESREEADGILSRAMSRSWDWGAAQVDASLIPDEGEAAEEAARQVMEAASGRPLGHPGHRVLSTLHRGGTLGGAMVRPDGGMRLVLREPSAMPPAVQARAWTGWDGRLRLAGQEVPRATIAALGGEAATALRRRFPSLRDVPHEALLGIPAIRDSAGQGLSIPHLGWGVDVPTTPARRPWPRRPEQCSLTTPPDPAILSA